MIIGAVRRAAPTPLPDGLCAAACLGTGLIAAAYRTAATGAGGTGHFTLFWAGMAVVQIPAFLLLLRPAAPGRTVTPILVFLALCDSLPKYLRSPNHLLFYDELAHYRQTETILQAHALFQPNALVPILREYPGLHALSATLTLLCGLPTFQVALLLLVLLHLLALVGIVLLADTLGLSPRGAGLAACLYSINPGFLYFDAQYAYESLGVVLVIWSVLFLARGEAAGMRSGRWGWAAVAILAAAACVLTHHVSSYVLGCLALIMAAAWLRAMRRRTSSLSAAAPALACTALLWAGIAGWTIGVGHEVLAYFGPRLEEVAVSVLHVAVAPAPERGLFAGSTTPPFERAAAFLSPPLLLGLTIPGIIARPEGLRCPHMWAALVALAACYLPSCALMLTTGGNEVARRSWSFVAIGLAMVTARGLSGQGRRLPASWRIVPVAGLSLVLYLISIGNTAMQTNEPYRFPGPVLIGTDVRTQTAELLDTVQWFTQTQGGGRRVIADRDDALAFAAFGGAWTARAWIGLPIWTLFLDPGEPPSGLVHKLVNDGYVYLILDRRITGELPGLGYYVSPQEPSARRYTGPVPIGALARYATWPWATTLLQTDHLTIYRLAMPEHPSVPPVLLGDPAVRAATGDGPERRR